MDGAGLNNVTPWTRPPVLEASGASIPSAPTIRFPMSRLRRTSSLIDNLARFPSAPVRLPPALARSRLRRFTSFRMCNLVISWRTIGSSELPILRARSIRRLVPIPRPPSPSAPRLVRSVKSPTRLSRRPARAPGATEMGSLPAPPRLARSTASVVLATAHPAPVPPITASWETRASSKNTSLNRAWPVISRRGRTSIPGCSMSMAK